MESLGLIEATGPTVNIFVREPEGAFAASPRCDMGKEVEDNTWFPLILVGVAFCCCVVNMVEFE